MEELPQTLDTFQRLFHHLLHPTAASRSGWSGRNKFHILLLQRSLPGIPVGNITTLPVAWCFEVKLKHTRKCCHLFIPFFSSHLLSSEPLSPCLSGSFLFWPSCPGPSASNFLGSENNSSGWSLNLEHLNPFQLYYVYKLLTVSTNHGVGMG